MFIDNIYQIIYIIPVPLPLPRPFSRPIASHPPTPLRSFSGPFTAVPLPYIHVQS